MPQIPLAEAGRRLHLHPLNLLIRLRQHGCASATSDCWPQVDEAFVETLRQLDGSVVHVSPAKHAPPRVENGLSSPTAADSFSAAAKKVVEKMWRKKFLGGNQVSTESIQKMWQEFSSDDVDAAIQELDHAGLVKQHGKKGTWSLDAGRTADIQKIADEVVKSMTARKVR